jgi:pyridoxal phosphate enzyme (YggS family)
MPESIRENIARVQERIAVACGRVGRSPQEVRLVAASKNVPPERIREAYEAGLRDFGENRVQEAGSKRPALADLTFTWHLIGHLQSNKAKAARDLFHWVQSLDSFRLAERLHGGAPSNSGRLTVLVEVNLGGEPTKSGVAESEVLDLARRIGELETLELRGLMLVPPYFEDPGQARPCFLRLPGRAQIVK